MNLAVADGGIVSSMIAPGAVTNDRVAHPPEPLVGSWVTQIGRAIPNGGINDANSTVVNFETQVSDNSALRDYPAGFWAVIPPVGGIFHVDAQLSFLIPVNPGPCILQTALIVNNVKVATTVATAGFSGVNNASYALAVSRDFPLNALGFARIEASHNCGTGVTLRLEKTENYFNIHRIGFAF